MAHQPAWDEDGQPANIEAAAADGLEWLEQFQRSDALGRYTLLAGQDLDDARARLGRCIVAITGFLPEPKKRGLT